MVFTNNKQLITNNRFTLMELLVVIAIIGILATMVLRQVGTNMDAADALTVNAELKAVAEACKVYEQYYGGLPTMTYTNTLIKILKAKGLPISPTDAQNPKRMEFLDAKLFVKEGDDPSDTNTVHHFDMWGGVITISGSSSTGYTLTSPGPDGTANTGDEVIFVWE